MAKKNISQLPVAGSLFDSDIFYVVQGATDYQVTAQTIKDYIGAGTSSDLADGGTITGQLVMESSIEMGWNQLGRPRLHGFTYQTGSQNGVGPTTLSLGDEPRFRKFTLTTDVTLTFEDVPAAADGTAVLTLFIYQDDIGGHTITWPSEVRWAGGTAPTLSTGANTLDIIELYFVVPNGGDGTDYVVYGVVRGQNYTVPVPGGGAGTGVLLNETGISGASASDTTYSFELPAGATRLRIATSGGTGDSDLYIKYGSAPTTSDYDAWPGPSNPTGDEEAVFIDPPAGTWHVLIHGFTAYSGLDLIAEYENTVQTLTSGVAEDFLAGPSGNEAMFQIQVPAGSAQLDILADEEDGEFALYARAGAEPTTVTFDESSDTAGGNESITVLNPTAGTWYIMLKAGETAPNDFYSRVSLTATVTADPPDTLASCTVPGTSYTLVEGKDATNADPDPFDYATPEKGVYFEEPTYGTCIVRVTDVSTEGPGTATFFRNIYARSQTFNSDNSKMLVYASNGFWHIYNTADLTYDQEVPDLVGANAEPQWHPTDPTVLRFLPNNGNGMVIYEHDFDTGVTTTIADFTSVNSIAGHPGVTSIVDIWPTAALCNTGAEGSPSDDHQYWTFCVEDTSFSTLAVITYDLVNNDIIGILDMADIGMGTPNHVDTSPSGAYCIVGWNDGANNCATSTTGSLANPCGLMGYAIDFSTAQGIASRAPHADFAKAPNGDDMYVWIDADDGLVKAKNLTTGAAPITLFDVQEFSSYTTAMHISGKARNKPGWVLISTYADRSNSGGTDDHWFDKKVFALELVTSPRIYNIAHHRNVTTGAYFTEPHASVSRDFKAVVWNSNWGGASTDTMNMYLCELPDLSIPTATGA